MLMQAIQGSSRLPRGSSRPGRRGRPRAGGAHRELAGARDPGATGPIEVRQPRVRDRREPDERESLARGISIHYNRSEIRAKDPRVNPESDI